MRDGLFSIVEEMVKRLEKDQRQISEIVNTKVTNVLKKISSLAQVFLYD